MIGQSVGRQERSSSESMDQTSVHISCPGNGAFAKFLIMKEAYELLP